MTSGPGNGVGLFWPTTLCVGGSLKRKMQIKYNTIIIEIGKNYLLKCNVT